MNAPAPLPQADRHRARVGLFCGLGAYAAWGVLPIYFKALASVSISARFDGSNGFGRLLDQTCYQRIKKAAGALVLERAIL